MKIMDSVGFVLIVSSICCVIVAEGDQTSPGTVNQTDCVVNEACKSVHVAHSIINNNVICCLNGQIPSINMINGKIFCTCNPANTMTPEQLSAFEKNLHHTLDAVNQNVKDVMQHLRESLSGLGEKINAQVQNALG